MKEHLWKPQCTPKIMKTCLIDFYYKKALKVIDSGAIKIGVVVDENEKLVGTVTDGDIRRGILNNLSLDDAIDSVVCKTPTVCKIDDSKEKILEMANSHKKKGEYRLPSSIIKGNKMKILGHIIRTEDDDVLKSSTLDRNNNPKTPTLKRQYGPRANWANDAYTEAYDTLSKYDDECEERIPATYIQRNYIEKVIENAKHRDYWKKTVVKKITYTETCCSPLGSPTWGLYVLTSFPYGGPHLGGV